MRKLTVGVTCLLVFAFMAWWGERSAEASCCTLDTGLNFDNGCTPHSGSGCTGTTPYCAIQKCNRQWKATIGTGCCSHCNIDPPGTYTFNMNSDATSFCINYALPGACYSACSSSIVVYINPSGGVYQACVHDNACPDAFNQNCPYHS
jgi:hypothetical protein